MNQLFNIDEYAVTISDQILTLPVNDACIKINNFVKSQDASNLSIIFDFKSEGFQKEIIHYMNDIVKQLVTVYKYDIDKFIYHTGAASINSNIIFYDSLPFDFLPKNILLDSTIMEGPYYTNRLDRNVEINIKPKKFLSMNGQPRTVRRLATSWLIEQDLIKESFYSLHVNTLQLPLIEKYNRFVVDIITSDKIESMVLSKNFQNNEESDRIKKQDVYYFDNSYFSLVQETFYDNTLDNSTGDIPFYENILFSEKTFRPIYFKHPFVILGVKGSLAGLRECGYETFSPYFDESYDDIDDPVLRLKTAMAEVRRLCNLTTDEWLTIQLALVPIVEYNHKLLTFGITKALLGKRK